MTFWNTCTSARRQALPCEHIAISNYLTPDVVRNLLIQAVDSACCHQSSFRKLFVCSRPLPLRGSWLQPSSSLVVELRPLSNLLRGLPQMRLPSLQSPKLFSRRVTAELSSCCVYVASPEKVFTLFFNSATCSSVAFLATSCIDETSHRFHSRIRPCSDVVFTLVAILSISSVLLSITIQISCFFL